MTRSATRTLTLTGLAAAFAGACGEAPTAPGVAGTTSFSISITLPELETRLATSPARVEIKLLAGTLMAREVEVEGADELREDEEIRAGVAGMSVAGTDGLLTLDLGGLTVGFSAATRFEEEDGVQLSFDEFTGRVQAALDAGTRPAVKAERPAPASPQAPDDAGFFATRLELEDGGSARIELNIGPGNLIANPTPPPDAWLRVLGLDIELRVADGTTELEAEEDEAEGETDFEGLVSVVDLMAGTVTLDDGTVIRLVAGTEFEESGDDDRLGSLVAVSQAVAAGLAVEAEGEGLVESVSPRTLIAVEIRFEVEDDDHGPDDDDDEGDDD